MNKAEIATSIVSIAAKHVGTEGWNMRTLNAAAEKAGYSQTDVMRVFPGGIIDAVDHFTQMADIVMQEHYTQYVENNDQLRTRERIIALIRLRLSAYSPYKEAIRRALALYAMPVYAHRGLKALYNTVDTMWQCAGDTATDYNWYSKRMLLAGVYSSTLLYWLEDTSETQQDTWDFLERRIDDVMQIEKAKGVMQQQCEQFMAWSPLSFFSKMSGR